MNVGNKGPRVTDSREQVRSWKSLASTMLALPLGSLAKGAYWVGVSDGTQNQVRKLIVQ